MTLNKSIRPVFYFVMITVLASGCAKETSQLPHGHSIGKIHFDQSIPEHQYQLMATDLQALDSIPIDTAKTTEMKRVMKLPDATPQNLKNWLEDRVQYVVSENFDFRRRISVTSKATSSMISESSDEASEFTGSAEASVPAETPETDGSRAGATVMVMANRGFTYFDTCDRLNKSCEIEIPGFAPVQIKSPRTGIIQIGEGHFMERHGIPDKKLSDISYTLIRLSTFFHEARHSDGNKRSPGVNATDPQFAKLGAVGKGTLGFGHVKCPSGHAFEGEYACDANLNGPYTVGGLTLKSMIDSCKLCSEKSKEGLKLQVADAFSRVLTNLKITEWDDTPEGSR